MCVCVCLFSASMCVPNGKLVSVVNCKLDRNFGLARFRLGGFARIMLIFWVELNTQEKY